MQGIAIKLFIIAFLTFIITDSLWLSVIAKNSYYQHYAPWLRLESGQLKPLWWAVILVYLMFALSLLVFILPLSQGSALTAAYYGALLGLVIYGVYDFTCLAIFKDFPVDMAFIDWIWGAVLCSWSSFLTLYLKAYLE